MTASANFLPYARQYIDSDDVSAVTEVLQSDFLTSGPCVEEFEKKLAQTVDAAFVVSCSSGTAALHLAVLAAEIGPGDAVIVPSQTFVATANAVRYAGAEVVFCDVDPRTGLMTPATLLAAIEQADKAYQLKAVMPVHLNGQCADMVGIHKIAEAHHLAVIDDASHSLGASIGNAMVGSGQHALMTTFSFHPVKTICAAEGGAVAVNDPALADAMRRYRSHGIERDPQKFTNTEAYLSPQNTVNSWYYEQDALGYNYRISDVHCALGVSQLNKLDQFVAERQRLVLKYRELLQDFHPMVSAVGESGVGDAAWHLSVALIDFDAIGVSRDVIMRRLRARGIGTQVHYIPVHLQPYYQKRYGRLQLPGVEAYYAKCLSLPLFFGVRDEDIVRVLDALRSSIDEA